MKLDLCREKKIKSGKYFILLFAALMPLLCYADDSTATDPLISSPSGYIVARGYISNDGTIIPILYTTTCPGDSISCCPPGVPTYFYSTLKDSHLNAKDLVVNYLNTLTYYNNNFIGGDLSQRDNEPGSAWMGASWEIWCGK